MAKREVKQWITVNGVHVPIYEGQSKDEAVKSYIKDKTESYSTSKHWNKDDALKYMRARYKNGEHDIVLLSKKASNGDTIYDTAKNWEEGEYAEKEDNWSIIPTSKLSKEEIDYVAGRSDTYNGQKSKVSAQINKDEKTKQEQIKKNEEQKKQLNGKSSVNEEAKFEAIKEAFQKQASTKNTTYEVMEKDGKYVVVGGNNNGREDPGSWHAKKDDYLERGYKSLPQSDYKEWKDKAPDMIGKKRSAINEDINKAAEAHVEKIWNGGAANKEMYDAADKIAEKYGLDKEETRREAMEVMNKKYAESVQSRKSNLSPEDKQNAFDKAIKEWKEMRAAEANQNKISTSNITDAKNHNELVNKLKSSGLSLDSADAHTMERSNSLNGEKVTMYDKDGNEYKGTYNKYSDGGREIVNIEKVKDNSVSSKGSGEEVDKSKEIKAGPQQKGYMDDNQYPKDEKGNTVYEDKVIDINGEKYRWRHYKDENGIRKYEIIQPDGKRIQLDDHNDLANEIEEIKKEKANNKTVKDVSKMGSGAEVDKEREIKQAQENNAKLSAANKKINKLSDYENTLNESIARNREKLKAEIGKENYDKEYVAKLKRDIQSFQKELEEVEEEKNRSNPAITGSGKEVDKVKEKKANILSINDSEAKKYGWTEKELKSINSLTNINGIRVSWGDKGKAIIELPGGRAAIKVWYDHVEVIGKGLLDRETNYKSVSTAIAAIRRALNNQKK